ncbi:MAG: hypothetical protein ACLSA6_15815 [Holdemania massiliensis]
MVMIEENPQFTLQVESQNQDYQLQITPHEYRYLASNEADYVMSAGGTLIRLLPRYRNPVRTAAETAAAGRQAADQS